MSQDSRTSGPWPPLTDAEWAGADESADFTPDDVHSIYESEGRVQASTMITEVWDPINSPEFDAMIDLHNELRRYHIRNEAQQGPGTVTVVLSTEAARTLTTVLWDAAPLLQEAWRTERVSAGSHAECAAGRHSECGDPEGHGCCCACHRQEDNPADLQAPPVHLLLDLWQALGGDDEAFHAWWAEDPSFPDRWPQMAAAVAGNLRALRGDTNPPAGALLKLATTYHHDWSGG